MGMAAWAKSVPRLRNGRLSYLSFGSMRPVTGCLALVSLHSGLQEGEVNVVGSEDK